LAIRSRAPVAITLSVSDAIGCGVHIASTLARSVSLTPNTAAVTGLIVESPPLHGRGEPIAGGLCCGVPDALAILRHECLPLRCSLYDAASTRLLCLGISWRQPRLAEAVKQVLAVAGAGKRQNVKRGGIEA
jgi:hypothetical protein